MSVLYLVLPLAILLVGTAVFAFVWSVKNGQMDDLESPAIRMLYDDEGAKVTKSPSRQTQDGATDGIKAR
ncbi:MAG: cbb3-type cytochrome oxidase assembly protein CcoS [Myxococcales bacterium]|nr:cbb3-type cytochrome oxidase assembly protein CcoS [Myxococcales bacterium]